jgi:broad specificity phosphatase PhoE
MGAAVTTRTLRLQRRAVNGYNPRMSVNVVFETHSTSVDNENGIATGWREGALSTTGREQAKELGERRRDDGLAIVFTSDLHRAVETAEIAFAGSALPVERDPRLRECNYGSMNGRPRAELDTQRAQRLDEPWPGGESWRQAVARVAGFLEELRQERDGQRVLVIGHVATRWALDHAALGIPLEELVDAPFEWREGWEYELHSEPAP